MNKSPSQSRNGSPQRTNRVGSPGIVNFGTSNIAVDTTKVKLNAKGGILVTNAEIENAFSFLDIDKTGKVSLANLKKRLSVFFPEMTGKDYRFLMNGKREMTQHDMMELLSENEIVNFDPVAEAFKAYDKRGEGFIDPSNLKEIFHSFGLGDLTREELDVLMKAADIDKDGKITLDDFRDMLDPTKVGPEAGLSVPSAGTSLDALVSGHGRA